MKRVVRQEEPLERRLARQVQVAFEVPEPPPRSTPSFVPTSACEPVNCQSP